MNDLDQFQNQLGYHFKDRSLLIQALSHRSVGKPNNERLEFLGDSIIGFFIASVLFARFPKEPEGALTKMRASLVKKETLATIARELKISSLLIMGGGELKSGGFNRDSVLSDAFESVIGAVYIDSGITEATDLLQRVYKALLTTVQSKGLKDSKTALQEFLQKMDDPLPVYEVIKESGQAHNLIFTVRCTLPGKELTFTRRREKPKNCRTRCRFSGIVRFKNNLK